MTIRSLAAWVVLTGLIVTGCAFRGAIEDGHRLVAAEDYRGALAAYRQALGLDPDDAEAARSVAQVTPYALRDAERDLSDAVGRRAYEQAHEQAGYVRTLAPERGAGLDRLVESTMAFDLGLLVGGARMSEAYPLALRARRLYPGMPLLEERLAQIRRYHLDRSDTLLAEGHYPEALAEIEVVLRHEPALRAQLAPRIRRAREAWADAVAANADRQEQAGRTGAAAVLYARAFEIAGREGDAAAMRRLVEPLRRQGAFLVAFDETDADERSVALGAQARDVLATIPVVTLAEEDDEGATLIVALTAEAPGFADSLSHHTEAQQYVAGTRDVPNPVYEDLSRRLELGRQAVATLAARAVIERAEAQRLAAEATSCKGSEVQPAEAALGAAQAEHTSVARQLEAQRERVSELERELASLPDRTPDGHRKRLKEQLERARARLGQLEQAETQAAASERDARAALDRALARCQRQSEASDDAARALARTESELTERRREAAELVGELAVTPATVAEPIIDLFHFEVRDVTRACTAAARLRLEPAWTEEQERLQLSEQAATADSAHPAYPRYGVEADPLDLPLTDADLVRAAESALARRVATEVVARAGRYYRLMSERALALSAVDPHAATDMMVALLVSGRAELDPATIARFEAHLSERYGLQDPGLLTR